MTTRRGSQYYIQSYEAEIRNRIDPSKGKRKGNIPSETKSRQGSAISQDQVPETPIIETTIEIHPLGPPYGISMPYPIYGNLATSIIIGQIGHLIFPGILWPFHYLGPTWPLHHHQSFP
ncbi:hypothetical protein O181_056544 [Austropuccinia psidii MF-1]|uniref:Uncharacterized protein n=1 Tax=Austropuccinia psidii MF-1 TaxID=1389203 RepID=A0A9Q3E8S4_9BASI|nr:hypothetical protein [Austropuccinia psidii MF-1]